MAPVRSRSIFITIVVMVLVTCELGYLPPGSLAMAQTHVVRVSASNSGQLASLGLTPMRDVDYGAFTWLELTPADLATLQASGVAFQEDYDPFTLHLGGLSFDPLESEPVYPEGWGDPGTQGSDLHLVQFFGPTRDEWFSDLDSRGLEIVQPESLLDSGG